MIRQHRRAAKHGPANGEDASLAAPAREYPRPMLRRENWISLDGPWQFAIDHDCTHGSADRVKFARTIQVPFAPETPASGIHETGLFTACWYKRTFETPKLERGQRLILNFGAVDYFATVWVNDRLAVKHEGGYTPFSADITDLLVPGKQQTVVVQAEDDPLDLAKPRGKQDWCEQPHSIWYYRTSGIWQSVWMERVNETRIGQLHWTPCVENWCLDLRARIDGRKQQDLKLAVTLRHGGKVLADDTYTITQGETSRSIQLVDPGIDDARHALEWFPWAPKLIDAEVRLIDADGHTIDQVAAYTAMRSVRICGDNFLLNGRPLKLQLVLDQGYWPESGLTAPDDAALRRDVELIKSMGFNGVRKHQKIEDPRFLYWADQLGLLVWEEMPSAYRFSAQSIERLTKQWAEAIQRDMSHPCIVAWVPFNESWGVPDLPVVEAQRHAVLGMYYLTKSLDPTRPVISNDGWEMPASDLICIHDYDGDPNRIARRYAHGDGSVERLLSTERPGHRVLTLDGHEYLGQPIVLSEFGGIAFSKDDNGTWGYSRAKSAEDFELRYARLLETVRSLPMLAGFCYTQFTDTYQEANGLLYMDRTPKFGIEHIAIATNGPQNPADEAIARNWRERCGAASGGCEVPDRQ
ncbi:glycoside hydrolase family 2 TIM barrel-domain containing protein [soil metagenome]